MASVKTSGRAAGTGALFWAATWVESTNNPVNATTLTVSSFFMSPPDGGFRYCFFLPKNFNSARRVSELWFEHENRGLFLVVSGRGHVVTVEFRRPEGSTGSRSCRDFPDSFAVASVVLLIRESIPGALIAAPETYTRLSAASK